MSRCAFRTCCCFGRTSSCERNSRSALRRWMPRPIPLSRVISSRASPQRISRATRANLDYTQSGKRHLIFFLSPKCRYCAPQAPLWRDVLNSIDATRFDVVGVVGAKEDKQAVSAHIDEFGYTKTKTPLPILFFNDDSLSSYKLVGTPTTLLIDDTGKVEHAWVGLWDDETASQVADALK